MDDWRDWFIPGESPYFAMYKAGLRGVLLPKLIAYCEKLNIPLRDKDIANWRNGFFKKSMNQLGAQSSRGTLGLHQINDTAFLSLSNFKSLPEGWVTSDIRWFPCSSTNKPLVQWGHPSSMADIKNGKRAQLYTREDAKALSPCGWVGQNLYRQLFFVIDIDGVGHGTIDEKVIEFGEKYKRLTNVYEAPEKPGSFHLYFKTNLLIPRRCFPFAKLDIIGNAVNSACYMKNKVSNHMPMMELTQEVWDDIMNYIQERKKEKDAAVSAISTTVPTATTNATTVSATYPTSSAYASTAQSGCPAEFTYE